MSGIVFPVGSAVLQADRAPFQTYTHTLLWTSIERTTGAPRVHFLLFSLRGVYDWTGKYEPPRCAQRDNQPYGFSSVT